MSATCPLGALDTRKAKTARVPGWDYWVSAFGFDWGVTIEVHDRVMGRLVRLTESGKDIVDEQWDSSFPNLLRGAYRERLTKLMDDEEVRAALLRRNAEPLTSDSDKKTPTLWTK